jgi:hypothetical protein
MIVTALKHLAFILVAFLISSVITGYVVNFSLLFYTGDFGDKARENFPLFGLSITLFLTYCAVTPAAATVAVGEFFRIRHWWYYALAGSAIGLGLGTMFSPPGYFPWLGLCFGPVSGLMFWYIAGRRAGLDNVMIRYGIAAVLALITGLLIPFVLASWFGIRF